MGEREEGDPERGRAQGDPADEVTEDEARARKRRRFLLVLNGGLVATAAAVVTVPVVGVLVWPLGRLARREWIPVMRIDELSIGSTVKVRYARSGELPYAGRSLEEAAYLRRETEDQFVAFSAYCTHTGCPVRWLEGAQLFLCPCHGGTFHRNGDVAGGPPPLPLLRHEVRTRDGRVEILTEPLPAAVERRGG